MNRLNKRKERLLNEIADRVSQMLLQEEDEKDSKYNEENFGDLSKENLVGRSFRNANLGYAKFGPRQDLRDADFRGADLRYTTNFIEALTYTGSKLHKGEDYEPGEELEWDIKRSLSSNHMNNVEVFVRRALKKVADGSIKYDEYTSFPVQLAKVFKTSMFTKAVGKTKNGGFHLNPDVKF